MTFTFLSLVPQLSNDIPVQSVQFSSVAQSCLTLCDPMNRSIISWLQSPSVVILEPQKIKSVTVSIVSPFICYEVTGLDARS